MSDPKGAAGGESLIARLRAGDVVTVRLTVVSGDERGIRVASDFRNGPDLWVSADQFVGLAQARPLEPGESVKLKDADAIIGGAETWEIVAIDEDRAWIRTADRTAGGNDALADLDGLVRA